MTTVFVALLVAISLSVWNNSSIFGHSLASLVSASREAVFERGAYWQLWTTLFVHADTSHLLSNLLLFIPLSYFLIGYFGLSLFPVLGLLIGGLTNYLTLKSMPTHSSLVGISGVVFWMGAVWLTLYALLESKESVRRRVGKSLVIGAALFLPQGYEPHISYAAHTYGFLFGVATAFGYYALNRRKFKSAEVLETIVEEPADWEVEWALAQEAERLQFRDLLQDLATVSPKTSLDNRYSPDLRPCRTC